MDIVLVDTNVLSYLSSPSHRLRPLYAKHVQGKTVALSFVTVAEIFSGMIKNPGMSAARREELESRLKVALIIPSDELVCRAYAEIKMLKTPNGSARVIAENDRWIAACAKRHGLPLISHNRKHFEDIPGVTLICEQETDGGLYEGLSADAASPT